MRLPVDGREYAHFTFDGLPDDVTPAAEIEGTWHDLTLIGDVWSLLVYGPDAPAGDGVEVTADTSVRVRVTDNPEIIIRGAGRINLVPA